MRAHTDRDRWWIFADAFVVIFALFWIVDWLPLFIQIESGDEAFTYSFHYFHGTLSWGTDVFQTNAGPWSIIYFPQYHPDTFSLLILGQSALALVVALTVLRIFGRLQNRAIGIASALAAITLLSLGDTSDSRFFFMAMAALLLMPNFAEKRIDTIHFLLLAALALSFLVKGTFIVVFTVVWLYSLAAELRAQRIPLTSFLAIVTLLALHLAAGQDLSGLPGYVASTLDAAGGYSERFGETGSPAILFSFVIFGLAFWLVLLRAEMRHHGALWGMTTSLIYAALMFGLYKQSFVRQDGDHVIRGVLALVSFAACYTAVRLPQIKPSLGRLGALIFDGPRIGGLQRPTLLSILGAAILLAGFLATRDIGTWSREKGDLVTQRSAAIWAIARGDRLALDDIHDREAARIRDEIPLPPLAGPVAVYDNRQTVPIAHGLDLQPIPTSTPYIAMSPRSENANRRFFAAPTAPEFVIVGDLQYSRQSTGLALLANYRPYSITKRTLVLQRTATTNVTPVPYSRAELKWGETFPVPDSGGAPVWAKLHYRTSLLNRIVGFLYQPVPVSLELFRGEELVYRIRLVQALAGEGMILSPNFDSVGTIAALDTEQGRQFLATQPVTAMRFVVGEEGNWLFLRGRSSRYIRPRIDVEFFRLEFAGDQTPTSDTQDTVAALDRLLALRPAGSQSPPILTTAAGAALKAGPQYPLRLSLKAGSRSIRVKYGLLGGDDASAEFGVSLQRRNGETQVLWSTNVDGGGGGATKSVIVNLPDPAGEGAALVLTASASRGGLAFWADIVILE